MRIAIIALLVFTGPAFAEPSVDAFRACGKIEDSVKRLECFDRLTAAAAPVAEPIIPPENKGNWQVQSDVSKIDDTTNVFLALNSIEEIEGRFGRQGHMTLMIVCREKKTNLYITFAGHFMSSIQGAGTVTYRLDQESAKTASFSNSSDNQALGLWSGSSAVPFVKSMLGKQKLLVRAQPYSESAVTGEFKIAGVENAIEPLRKACGW